MGIKSVVKDVKSAAKAHFHGDLICNEPMSHEGSLDGIDPVDIETEKAEYTEVNLPWSKRPLMRTLLFFLEAIVSWWILTAPSWILSAVKQHPRYSIVRFKVGDAGFVPDMYQEFWRLSCFIATSYVAYLFSAWAVGMISTFLLGFAGVFKLPVSGEVRHSLKLIKRTQGYIAIMVWFLLLLFLGSLLLYTPALLKPDEDVVVNALLNRESSERLLIAASFITALFALEKYLIQVVTYAFHRESLSQRIADINSAMLTIGNLYRRCRYGQSSRVTSRNEFADVGLHDLHQDDIINKLSATAIADGIYKACVPPDRAFLKPEDLRPYLDNEEEAKKAFRLLDGELRGKIDLKYLMATVETLLAEKDLVRQAQADNGLVIRRFDNVLMVIVAVLSIVGGLSLYHAKGYTLVVSLFSLFLTLAFLVKDTMTRLSDAFRLIYIQRAFDVGDVITVDGNAFTVTHIRLFTSTFLKNSDKSVVYIPNHILAGKVILNQKRLRLTVDKATISVFGTIPMARIGDFKAKLKTFTEETYPEFSGTCAIKIKELAGGRIDFGVDLTFQPTTDEKVLARRNKFKQKVVDILEDLQIAAAPPTF